MLAQKILAVLEKVLHRNGTQVLLSEPIFRGNEWAYVKDCLDTNWVSTVGGYVDRLEEMLAEFTGVRRAVAMVNGTAALHLSLKLVGVEPGDEVLVPALTFVATANAVAYCSAVPHFVDSEEATLGLDADKLRDYLSGIAQASPAGCRNKVTGRIIRAVVPVHTFGHPVDLDPLVEVCRRFRLEMVEDAAEALGSYYKGRHTGNWGRAAILSFNGNKIITTGGGGAILTNDEELGKLAKHLSTTARIPQQWGFFHDQTGFNYRLPNINAALGCAQLEQLPDFLEKNRTLAKRYEQAFRGLEGVEFFTEPGFARSNYWLNVLLLAENQPPAAESSCESQAAPGQGLTEVERLRDVVLKITNSRGIGTRPAWTLMHKLPMFGASPRMDLTVAESIERRLINIPSGAKLSNSYV